MAEVHSLIPYVAGPSKPSKQPSTRAETKITKRKKSGSFMLFKITIITLSPAHQISRQMNTEAQFKILFFPMGFIFLKAVWE